MTSPPESVARAAALSRPVTGYADVDRLLMSRVRDDPRPYEARAAIAGRAVSALLERAGRPQERLRFLHVAGSKGKGSTALMAEHLLRSPGEPTGTFTSPHLRRWNERVRVNGAPVDDDALAGALEALRPHVAELDALGEDDAPTFFDLVTAAALLAFARAGCRTVVLEAGLGGLYDATNVVTPAACCITSIELEHTDKLGTTLAAIARHKAGIIKPGAPVVTGDLPPEALAVVETRVRETGVRELRWGRDWLMDGRPGPALATQLVHYRERATGYAARFTLPHPAPHMAVNAGLAVALVRAAGFDPDPGCLANCSLPARAQVLAQRPWILVDGAHTAASLAALEQTLAAIPATRRHFLVSATRGKALEALAHLARGAVRVLVTRADPVRSAPAAEVAARLRALLPHTAIHEQPDPRTAIAEARHGLADEDVLCVCGSVYLAGLAQDVLEG